MSTPLPVARTARRITYKFQTHDVRKYILEDVVARTRHAVSRAGGELRGGVLYAPKHIKRWCVNRSPHVNKTSREHFWLVTHRRAYRWDADAHVDREAPLEISKLLPATIAIRVVEERPGLMCLKDMWDMLNSAGKPGGKITEEGVGSVGEVNKQNGSADPGMSEASADIVPSFAEGAETDSMQVDEPKQVS